ncbi:MAG TPA: amidohydrolase family protein [Propylenella sp.]|nr:amidohydrolase family protein [Propylenella sp.]
MPDFPIVDTHVHLYDPNALSYPWVAGIPLLNKPYLPEDYSRLSAGTEVEKLVFVEVDVADGQNLREARWVEELAIRDTRIAGIVAAVPMERGRAVEEQIAELAKLPLVRGVRRLIQHHVSEPGWCVSPPFIEAVQLLPRYGLSFDICILSPQMADPIELVRRCPETQFVLDHIGKPQIKAGIREPWWREIVELAAEPNVWCKISGVVTEADHKAWSYDQAAPYIARAIEAFGFDRVMFGSDWPVSELATSFGGWVEVVDRVTSGASSAELQKLYRDNARAFYRL